MLVELATFSDRLFVAAAGVYALAMIFHAVEFAAARAKAPVLVVGSQDDADFLHPLGVAQEYCRKLPNCELVVEEKGQSPLAWQGARLSNVIADFLERVGYS